MTHTAGPWTLQQCQQKGMLDPWRILSPTGEVAIIDGEADARLIAAAPMLLEALQQIAKHQEIVAGTMAKASATWNIANKAIELAKGKP